MELEKLFEMQKVLDNDIVINHPVGEGDDRLTKKILALHVELAELAQEWRGFKFWSTNQKASDRVLDEYVDVLHFILSIGLEMGYERVYPKVSLSYENLEIQFNELFLAVSEVYAWKTRNGYLRVWEVFLRLGEYLGLEWSSIEEAYFKKNEENHQRQDDGY